MRARPGQETDNRRRRRYEGSRDQPPNPRPVRFRVKLQSAVRGIPARRTRPWRATLEALHQGGQPIVSNRRPASRPRVHRDGTTQGTRVRRFARELERTDLFSARSLGALADFEGDLLSLLELVEVHAFDRRHVEEHVLAVTHSDESKTLVRKTFNRTFSHYLLSL